MAEHFNTITRHRIGGRAKAMVVTGSRLEAVQTLSRLNRMHPLKEDTFVLDFVNAHEEIREAFKQYYEGSKMSEEAELDTSGIYTREDLDAFVSVYFKHKKRLSQYDEALTMGSNQARHIYANHS